MNARRTRRDVLCGTAGFGAVVAAGCLGDDGAHSSNETDGNGSDSMNGDDDATDPRSLSHRWLSATSSQHDFSTLQFGYYDIAAITSVSSVLPDAVETELKQEAYEASGRILGIEELLGRDAIDEVFAFGNGSRTFNSPPMAGCGVFAGSFDVESIRTEFESSEDEEHRTVAGFDLYTDDHVSIAISPETAAVPNESMSIAEFESVLERVRSADVERNADTAAFERFEDRLGDGTYVTGELTDEPIRETGENGNLIGHGEAITFGERTTTARVVGLFDATEDELIDEIDPETEAARREEVYDDVSAEINGSELVITASVETNRFVLR